MKRYGIVFAALVAGDALTTAYGLIVAGAVELNPLGPVAALAAKSIVTMLALALLHWQEPRYRFASAVPFSIALTVPVAFNLAALTGVIG